MDSNNGSGNSLPGIGMPRWMKRTTERYNYADICASPPSNEDGFIHMNRHRLRESNSNPQENVECVQKKKSSLEATSTTVSTDTHQIGGGTCTSLVLAKQDCAALKEASNFYKNITTTPSSLVSLALASQDGSVMHPKQGPEVEPDVSLYTKAKTSVAAALDVQNFGKKKPALDSAAPTPHEEVPISVSKAIRNQDDGKYQVTRQLIGKINGIPSFPPDDGRTPSSTPSQTPTCSPQVPRRAGNPFFSGTQEKTNGGNWLFRSSTPPPYPSTTTKDKIEETGNSLGDTKLEKPRPLSANTGGSSVSQKVRYVPRPSELRELNFWSPTSM